MSEELIGCQFCGEKVSAEAKLCRHCDRSLLVSVFLPAELSNRQAYSLFKSFTDSDADERHLKFDSLSSFKKYLKQSQSIPLASELTVFEADQLLQKHPSLEKRMAAPSFAPAEQKETPHGPLLRVVGLASAFIFMACLTLYLATTHFSKIQELNSESGSQELSQWVDAAAESTAPLPSHAGKGPPLRPQESVDASSQEWTREDVEKLLNATVFIKGDGSVGSGFLISADGDIVTNRHVLERMSSPQVHLRNGESFDVYDTVIDDDYDLALVRIRTRDAPFLKIGDANQLHPGQTILTIGNPSGLSWTITRGIISYIGREINGASYIQTDAAINPGNSGGPMITSTSEVVGVNTLTARQDQGISFALPINFIYRNGGVAENSDEIPSSRPSFVSGTTTRISATVGGAQNQSLHPYEKELSSLKSEFDRQDRDIKSRAKQIKSRIDEIKQDLTNQNLPKFQIERRREELAELYQEYNVKLQADHLQAQKLYYQGSLALLQKQRWDSSLSQHVDAIEKKMDELRSKLRTIENQLASK